MLQSPTPGAALLDDAAAAGSVSIAVSADDVTRRYGSGEAAVDALRGVTLDIPRGQFAADHGPVGLRQVDADALLAGLDRRRRAPCTSPARTSRR